MCRFLLEQVVAPFFHVVSQAGFFSFVLGNICGGMVVVAVALVGLKEGLVPTGADNARRLSDF